MSIVVVNFMQIFMGVVLYSLLGVIVAGGYRMAAAWGNRERALGLPNDNITIGVICIVWPMFVMVVLLGAFFSGPVGKLGEIICNLFHVDESSIVEKKKENEI